MKLQDVARELIDAASAVTEAGFVCSPELWARLSTALVNARAVFPIDEMPAHNELVARGAESLGDGVYVEATPEGIMLTGNAYARENVIYLEARTYRELRKFATLHGYEPNIDGAKSVRK